MVYTAACSTVQAIGLIDESRKLVCSLERVEAVVVAITNFFRMEKDPEASRAVHVALRSFAVCATFG